MTIKDQSATPSEHQDRPAQQNASTDAKWERFKSRIQRALSTPDDHIKSLYAASDSELRLGNLIESVKRMAIYAAEIGQLPKSVDLGFVYQQWNKKFGRATGQPQELNEDEINKLANYFSILELQLGEVTANSLKATSCLDLKHCMKNEAGRYVRSQKRYAITLVLLLAVIHIFDYWYINYGAWTVGPVKTSSTLVFLDMSHKFTQYLAPFLYGTLGAFAFTLRATESRIRRREFEPRRIPGNIIRILLGSLSGGAIVLFFQNLYAELSPTVAITTAALGFLAGYNTDLLFSTMDKITKAITPSVEEPLPQETIDKKQTIRELEERIQKQNKTAKTVHTSET